MSRPVAHPLLAALVVPPRAGRRSACHRTRAGPCTPRPGVAVGPDGTLYAIGGSSRHDTGPYLATVEAYTPSDGPLGGAFLPSGAPAGSAPSGA
jgi:hypothetical protein